MKTKRFVAGAVCPRCGEMDRIVTYETASGVFKECVHCDYHEQQQAQVVPQELSTRVAAKPEKESETAAEVSVVKFVPDPHQK